MMLDHVTYHVAPGTLEDPELQTFLSMLGFLELQPEESVPEGWRVRWFTLQIHSLLGVRTAETKLHLVEAEYETGDCDALRLGHFCVRVGRFCYAACRASKFLARDSGSGRIWVEFANLRVEVRP